MFENNKDFYPTPKPVIDMMLSGVDFKMVFTILEPSAGKGDLADGIKEAFDRAVGSRWGKTHELDLDCIEIQPELQMILKGKGYRVVHNDFLTYNTFKRYDLIISNPPFSSGAKHLLKMLEMQQRIGGGVICLLNAETLKNPCTAERAALLNKLSSLNADIKYIPDAFVDAERKTPVEVAVVKVLIPKEERPSFIYDDVLKRAEDLEYREMAEQECTDVAENDLIRAIVKQYNLEVDAGIRLIEEFTAMKPHILNGFGEEKNEGCMLKLCINTSGRNDTPVSYNGFVKMVRRKYWKALFSNAKFTGKLTSKLLEDYHNRVSELEDYDFSVYNIMAIRAEMSKQTVKGVEDAIISLFDELSHQYSYYDTSKNIHYYNGWRTNKSWIINKKVIIPLCGFRDLAFSWGGFDPTHYTVTGKLKDIEKCLNYLDGGLTDSVDLEAALNEAKEAGKTSKIQLKYFTVTFYKKGTCHIEFKNEELLKKFNIFGAQRKGWLPPSYGKKKYSEMEPEERAVVDEFEGEKEYSKVIGNTGYYICKTDNLMMLESFEGE